MRIGFVGFIIAILASLSSCEKQVDDIPSYLKSDSAAVNDTRFGEPISYIYGLNISVENDARGSWQFPFLMPILKEGVKELFIKPIVKRNNLSTYFDFYPMYKPLIIPMNLEKGKQLDTNLVFEYESSVSSLMLEDMEIRNNFSNSSITSQAYKGKGSLHIHADNTSSDSSATSYYYKAINFDPSKIAYLEFDYYMPEGACAPALSYEDNLNQRRTVFDENYLVPNQKWTHVYWFLTPNIRTYGLAAYTPTFVLTIRKGASSADIYLDNIKIVEK